MSKKGISLSGALLPELERALTDPDFYPHPVEGIRVEETHISRVFLTGSFVYKVKKPVNLGFLDFSSLEKRRGFCEREVLLNQRLTRGVYLEVVAVTREPTGYALGGPGEPVEYAVKMRQLPRERTMGEMLSRGELSPQTVRELGAVLAGFYERARRGHDIDRMGSLEVTRANVEENFEQTRPFVPAILELDKFESMHRTLRKFMRRKSKLFQRRVDRGRIRDCHGDLRLDHVYILEPIQIIDCIEFNDRFRYSDVAADLAFIAMDMDYHGSSSLAQDLLVSYALAADDPEVFTLLDFYKCYRAHVRSKVKCFQSEMGESYHRHHEAEEVARKCFDLAYRYARVLGRSNLWVVCGMIGSGKSTIAGELEERLKVRVFRSDAVRKRLSGIEPSDPAPASFQEGIYTRSRTDETYTQMLLHAKRELAKGRSAVLDATFGRRRHRRQAIELAEEMGANLIFAQCVCPETLLKDRLAGRSGRGQVSDARLEHFNDIQREFEPMDEVGDAMYLEVKTDRPLIESLVQLFAGTYACQHRQAAEFAGEDY